MINECKIQYNIPACFRHNSQLHSDGDDCKTEDEQTFLLSSLKSISRYSNCFVHHAEVLLDQSISECDYCIDNCACCLEVKCADP